MQPLSVYDTPVEDTGRINLVTDSISSGSLFGGVGTALVFAALLAEARGDRLRIVTRNDPPEAANLDAVLRFNGIALTREPEFVHLPFARPAVQLGISHNDRFITTSWWTTRGALSSIALERILYLVQEDERMFYPHGDDWVGCDRTLRTPGLELLVNARLLFDHLETSGLDGLSQRARYFEPAFPAAATSAPAPSLQRPRRLLFYARPNNLRNLFHAGIEAIDALLMRGVIDPTEWQILFVGKDIPRLTFSDGTESRVLPLLNWEDYHGLLRDVDVGLALMSTPHPSYPPLDLAAAGAVAVTNRFGNKRDLSGYSPNILCADLDDIAGALTAGVELALDHEQRRRNFAGNRMHRDWRVAFADVIDHYRGWA
jgi:hypothetical protein